MKPYTYGDYALYARDVVLKNGNGTQRIYFFSRGEPRSGFLAPLPRGYRVDVSPRTGMPLLKKDPMSNPGSFGWLRRYFN